MPKPVAALLCMLSLLCAGAPCRADMIAFRDYIQLKNGMSEAEVLYRAGPADYESLSTDRHHNILRRVWYYIPPGGGSDAWITEIEFDRSGSVQSLQRYRARR